MCGNPPLWHKLLTGRHHHLVPGRASGAGVQAIQLFGSWAGALSPRLPAPVLPHGSRCSPLVARIRGSTSAWIGELLSLLGGRVRTWSGWTGGCRWTGSPPGRPGKALQGSLDPAVLAPWDTIAQRARDVLERGRTAEGTCSTGPRRAGDRPDMLARLTDLVHAGSDPGQSRLAAQLSRPAASGAGPGSGAGPAIRRRPARRARRGTAAAPRPRSAARRSPRAGRASPRPGRPRTRGACRPRVPPHDGAG